MERRRRRLLLLLLSLGLLLVVVGAASQVGDGRREWVTGQGGRSVPATPSISAIPDTVVGAAGPAVRSLRVTRLPGPDRSAALLGVAALSLLVAGAAWARGLIALPPVRRPLATAVVHAAPRAPPRSV